MQWYHMHTLNPPLELGFWEKGRGRLRGRVRGAAAQVRAWGVREEREVREGEGGWGAGGGGVGESK